MDPKPKKKSRSNERRRLKDRRTGEYGKIFKLLNAKGAVQDLRQSSRRRGNKSKTSRLTHQDRYEAFLYKRNEINSDRKKAGLKPLPNPSFAKWREQRAQKGIFKKT